MIPANMLKFYIDGQWVDPISTARIGVENPATEEIVCEVAMGNALDSDRATVLNEHSITDRSDHELGTVLGGVLQVGLRRGDLHALLAAGVAVTTERVVVGELRIARDEFALMARCFEAGHHELRVAVGDRGCGVDAQPGPDPIKVLIKLGRVQTIEPQVGPLRAHRHGRAQTDHRVDHGAAAQGLTAGRRPPIRQRRYRCPDGEFSLPSRHACCCRWPMPRRWVASAP